MEVGGWIAEDGRGKSSEADSPPRKLSQDRSKILQDIPEAKWTERLGLFTPYLQ
jgi:hypothetical protein